MDYNNLINTRRVFCDTSFFYEMLDEYSRYHQQCVHINRICAESQILLYTTWEIINETVTLLRTRYSYSKAMIFIEHIVPDVTCIDIDLNERKYVFQLFKKLSRDKELSLCDVISYFVVREKLDIKTPCLSFDDDFRSLGLLVIR